MPYNSFITRNDADALIPEEVSYEIIQAVPEASAVMKLAKKLPNMSRGQVRMPVLSALASAYFVAGSTDSAPGLKQTTKIEWANKYINAAEIACIVPIPEAVLDDADYDIWGQVKPQILEAFGAVIDAAILFGTNKPSDWPTAVITAAIAAGNNVAIGSGVDLYDDLLGEDGVISKVELDGFMPNGNIAHVSMRGKLRGVRDANGNPIFKQSMQDGTPYELDGMPIEFPRNGSMGDGSTALLVTGDYSKLVWSVRQDITYKILDQAVLTDADGNITLNLAQQDMVALRAVMRMGWQVPNPINRMKQTEADRYPFAVLQPAN